MRIIRSHKETKKQRLARELVLLRDQIDSLKKQADAIQRNLLSITNPKDVVSLTSSRSLLRVDPEPSEEISDELLRSLVPDTVWEAITVRVVDNKAIALAIRTGVLSPDILVKASITKPAKASHFRTVRHDPSDKG